MYLFVVAVVVAWLLLVYCWAIAVVVAGLLLWWSLGYCCGGHLVVAGLLLWWLLARIWTTSSMSLFVA